MLTSERYRGIIYDRFGLDDESKTLKTVGKNQEISIERVRQIEAKSLRILKVNHDIGKYEIENMKWKI